MRDWDEFGKVTEVVEGSLAEEGFQSDMGFQSDLPRVPVSGCCCVVLADVPAQHCMVVRDRASRMATQGGGPLVQKSS